MALSHITPEIRQFLDSMRVPCVMSTLRPDGAPITSATWFGFLDDDLIVSTPAAGNKARNVLHDPRVSVIVDTKQPPLQGVAVEGRAVVVPDPDGELLTLIAARYVSGEALRAVRQRLHARGERVIVRITAQRVRPWQIPAPATAQHDLRTNV